MPGDRQCRGALTFLRRRTNIDLRKFRPYEIVSYLLRPLPTTPSIDRKISVLIDSRLGIFQGENQNVCMYGRGARQYEQTFQKNEGENQCFSFQKVDLHGFALEI